MEMFLMMVIKPFMAFGMLLVAWPIKRLVQLKMMDGRIKRLLLLRIGRE